MLMIMDMMKIRMRYSKDIQNHTYFFTKPDYRTTLGEKFIKKLKQPALTNVNILKDLAERLEEVPAEDFNATALNKTCSLYLYDKNLEG
jgi:hypothetical protein